MLVGSWKYGFGQEERVVGDPALQKTFAGSVSFFVSLDEFSSFFLSVVHLHCVCADDPIHPSKQKIKFLKDFMKDTSSFFNRLLHVCKLVLTGEFEEPDVNKNRKR